MKKRWAPALIFIGSLAMIGIIVVQFFWIRNALHTSSEYFDYAVNAALRQVVEKLEKKERVLYISKKYKSPSDTAIMRGEEIVSEFSYREPDPFLHKEKDSSVINLIFGMDLPGNADSVPGFVPPPKDGPEKEVDPGQAVPLPPEYKGSSEKLRMEVRHLNRKMRKMTEAMRDMVVEVETQDRSIETRLDTFSLRRELDRALLDRGISLPYSYAVTAGKTDSVTSMRSADFQHITRATTYHIGLFPNDLISKSDKLFVRFPGRGMHLFKSMSALMGASLVFTLALLLSFIFTVLALLRQKKLSEMKSDFINNMTHEFKTPIATISLAIDSINNPKVLNDPEKVKGYTHVIREENRRMNTHVEQVLQMAILDRKEMSLLRQELDLHDILNKAAENMMLQVTRRNGSIALDLQATNTMVMGDEVHLLNAVLNLLDNANKYSPAQPEISVYSRNQDNEVVFGVEDKGIGMNKDTLKRIFEKFYRVHTGNIHNVKGFGLGLSYVKAIIEMHGGKVNVWSEPGKGSRFEVSLPQ